MTSSTLRAVLAALLALACAGTARAGGMYYKELTKDGRIYVFNDAKRAEAFEKGGEMGVAITRIGVGPGGETVIADSEQALELFFFKNGIAEVVERPKPPTQKIEWRDGKTRITTDKAYLEMSSRVQARYTHELPDHSIQVAGAAAKGDTKGSFRIRRLKFKLEGWFYKPWLTYETQVNYPDVTGSPASRFVEDANINWDLSQGKKKFMIRFGQFKVPFGRQELTSSGAQQFVDRADVSNRYARGRETGISVWGAPSNKLEWRLGAFNGNGRSQSANDNDKFQFNGRLTWQPNGAVGLSTWTSTLSESDFESSDKPLFALAANFELNDKFGSTSNVDTKESIVGGDAMFKYKRFSAVAEYFNKNVESEALATGEKTPDFTDAGFYVQAGYLLDSKRTWELAFRCGQIDPSDKKDGDKRTEIGGVVNYYYNKHNLKVQADWRQVKDDAGNSGQGVKNQELRLQTQFIF